MKWWIPPALALQFLTRVPVPALNSVHADIVKIGLAKSVIWFSVIGGIVGAFTASILIAADHLWPRIIAVFVGLIVEARLTGAFHEDAVADFCDGFGGGMTPQRIHEIMKDSRIGSYGALGMGLAVALRAALLIALPNPLIFPALIASASFGRYTAVTLMAITPPLIQIGGLGKDIGAQVRLTQWGIASVLTLPFIALFAIAMPIPLLIAVAATLIFTVWFRKFVLQNLGGITGDCLGFGVYAGQLFVLLAANINFS